MNSKKLWEAVWTLQPAPIDDENLARRIFVAIGEVTPVHPVRYDLNRRRQWRPYSGRRFLVDVITQRTQLVTVVEEKSIEEGGAEVILATGKQDRPPQAVARWHESWPPVQGRIDELQAAARGAFKELPLARFLLHIGRDGEEKTVIDATSPGRVEWNSGDADE